MDGRSEIESPGREILCETVGGESKLADGDTDLVNLGRLEVQDDNSNLGEISGGGGEPTRFFGDPVSLGKEAKLAILLDDEEEEVEELMDEEF